MSPEERLVAAVLQIGCIRCEHDFEPTDETIVVTGLRLHAACLNDDDKQALEEGW